MTSRVTVPEGIIGDVEVRRFVIEPNNIQNRLAAFKGGRSTAPGEYTALYRNGHLWMSDTDAEWRDHYPATHRFRSPDCRSVLVNGLGLGMVVAAALAHDHVERVDVVEIDPDVIALVGPHYAKDPRVQVHEHDAYTMKWPTDARWDVAWHDIWIDLCTDNLDLMAKLHRKYGRKTGWQGSWGKELLTAQRRQERARERMWGW